MKPLHILSLGLALAVTAGSAQGSPNLPSGGLGESIEVDYDIFVVPEAVIEDSRCPVNVDCIWAGRLVLRVQMQFPLRDLPMTIEFGETRSVGSGSLTFYAASPERTTDPIPPQNYHFSFIYVPAR